MVWDVSGGPQFGPYDVERRQSIRQLSVCSSSEVQMQVFAETITTNIEKKYRNLEKAILLRKMTLIMLI